MSFRVRCGADHMHRSMSAAGLLIVRINGGRAEILMIQRGTIVTEAGLWGIPGGEIDFLKAEGRYETPVEAAVRETREEVGIPSESLVLWGVYAQDRHLGWSYTTILATLAENASAEIEDLVLDGTETVQARWVRADRVGTTLPNAIHPGFKRVLGDLVDKVDDLVYSIRWKRISGDSVPAGTKPFLPSPRTSSQPFPGPPNPTARPRWVLPPLGPLPDPSNWGSSDEIAAAAAALLEGLKPEKMSDENWTAEELARSDALNAEMLKTPGGW
ncbi:NUDIX hydrolase domain-like protein [Xylariomycetidae sp. FL2044]|nr:NUDIX hydrolase domain-like protein [Xylariomycetidae sp. FL2044]